VEPALLLLLLPCSIPPSWLFLLSDLGIGDAEEWEEASEEEERERLEPVRESPEEEEEALPSSLFELLPVTAPLRGRAEHTNCRHCGEPCSGGGGGIREK
jgi:hypothetical protein